MKKDREMVLIVAAVLAAGRASLDYSAFDPIEDTDRAKRLIAVVQDSTPESEGWQ